MKSLPDWIRNATLLSAILVTMTGCGDDDSCDCSSSLPIVCEPGDVKQCPCISAGTGVQSCNVQGTGWGLCQGCDGTGVVDVGDTGAPLGECDYTTCTGDICRDPEGCCDGAACDSWYYYDTTSISETYCYPMCSTTAAEPCKCGDVCKDIDTLPLCLKQGNFTMNGLTVTVWDDYDVDTSVEIAPGSYSGTLGSEAVTVEYVNATWTTWEGADGSTQEGVDIWFDGLAGTSSLWFVSITIMQETFTRGVGQYNFFDSDEDPTANFFADLYYANLDRTTEEISEVWVETIPETDTSLISIDQTCSICPLGGTDCTQCTFSFNINWLALRAKLVL